MKTHKEVAEELVEKYENSKIIEYEIYGRENTFELGTMARSSAIECAKIAVENEYYSLREQVIRLKPSLTESLYLKLIDSLIKEEQEVKKELNKML